MTARKTMILTFEEGEVEYDKEMLGEDKFICGEY